MKHKTYLNWSTGKDSAMALYYLKKDSSLELAHLLTSVNSHFERVSMHGVRKSLLEEQIHSVGIPYSIVELPEKLTNQEYENIVGVKIKQLCNEGYTHSAFGDIYLEDLRTYREEKLKGANLKAVFPLWKIDTKDLIHEFIQLGFKAIVVCINASLLDKSFLGRIIDEDFVKDLPPGIDPCGENGEFHTFCFDGPVFTNPVEFSAGEKVYKEYPAPLQNGGEESETAVGFWFYDLLPAK